MIGNLLYSILVILAVASGAAREVHDADPWDSYGFLVGEWTGEGSGEPGKGSGEFSFAWDLQKKVLVRRNRAEYPAGPGRPAISHEDLMVVYAKGSGGPLKAIYFDNEGHVINYTATVSDDKQTVTFLSDVAPGTACFRLSYVKQGEDAVGIKFEIAPPGKPDAFKTYLEGNARRKPRKSGDASK
jgi:hypothetical protein